MGEEPPVAGKARREPLDLAVLVAGAAVHVVVRDLAGDDDVHHAEGGVEAAGDAGTHHEVRRELADELHRADRGVHLADARLAQDDLVPPEGADEERAVLERDGMDVSEQFLDQGLFGPHGGGDADLHGVGVRDGLEGERDVAGAYDSATAFGGQAENALVFRAGIR